MAGKITLIGIRVGVCLFYLLCPFIYAYVICMHVKLYMPGVCQFGGCYWKYYIYNHILPHHLSQATASS